jgi:pantothenate kinase type III
MYEKFTDRSRKVMLLANQEALRSNLDYIGTEHVLVGLVAEDAGVAAHVLKRFDLDPEKLRHAIELQSANGSAGTSGEKRRADTGTEKLIANSLEEAQALNHNYVGTEHLLLGMVRDQDSVAAQILRKLNVNSDDVRRKVLETLGHDPSDNAKSREALPKTHRFFSAATSKLRVFANRVLASPALIAVDIGNSRMKLGLFEQGSKSSRGWHERPPDAADAALPTPKDTFDLQVSHETGEFDIERFSTWCGLHAARRTDWSIGSVHRRAALRLTAAISQWALKANVNFTIRQITYQDVPLPLRVDEPERIGIDRLLAALAANRLRARDRAAIIVDLGTAITVDCVEPDGGFAGGAILPGIGMSARALHEQTDALPRVAMERLEHPPPPLGKSTVPAIEAGIFWGTFGAVSELVSRQSTGLAAPPDLFVTGGGAQQVTELLAQHHPGLVHHVPHLVLAGIALIGAQATGKAGG